MRIPDDTIAEIPLLCSLPLVGTRLISEGFISWEDAGLEINNSKTAKTREIYFTLIREKGLTNSDKQGSFSGRKLYIAISFDVPGYLTILNNW